MTTGSELRGKWWRASVAALGLFGISGVLPVEAKADGDAAVVTLGADAAGRAVAPITPKLSGEVVAALQGGDYAEAARALDAILADTQTTPTDRSFYCLVRGGADRLAGRPEDARSIWMAALGVEPKGVWANKIRSELAALELATGHADRAEVMVRAEAEALLNPDRKDRLALVYRDFARRLLEPDFPGARPDPVAAYALLAKGRDLAKGAKLCAELLFAMGRAGQDALDQRQANNATPRPASNAPPVPNPTADYQAYLKEYPQGADRDEVRFRLGETQLALGSNVEARLTWTDLARDLAKMPAVERTRERQSLRGQALYGVARTYGVPEVQDNLSLNLGVAALREFLRETPTHPRAPLAAFQVGQSYLNRGQADPAIAAFRSFLQGEGYRVETDEARREQAELAIRATFLIARATFRQAKYPEAINAFTTYLNQYPNGAESSDARRAILDAQFAAAQEALNAEKYAEARAGWLKFADDHPLDERVPMALFLVGQTFVAEKKWDEAIAAWDKVAARFPTTEPAAHAQFAAAALLETEKGEPATAIERFRKITSNTPWSQQARQRIAVMEAKALTVVTPRTFRSGETAHLKITTRNLETLTFSAYKLNPEAYFRKKHSLSGVNSLDIGLVAPDAEWTAPVPNYAQYKPVEATFDLKVEVPGVYVVKVSDEKTLQAAALVIGSDLDAIVKVSQDQILVFAEDMKTGQGRKGARILVADGENVVFEGTTGEDGVAQGTWKRPAVGSPIVLPNSPAPAPDAALQYLVLDGANAAGSGLGVPDQVSRGLSARAYIDTDRPAYRPGQEVAIRGVIREVEGGQYANPAGQVYKLEVSDSQARLLVSQETTLSPFGTFHAAITIASGAPVGSYRIRVYRPGGSDFAGGFEVQAYQLEKLGLEFDLPRTVFYRGETIHATLKARYGFGAPANGRPITVQLPDGRTISGQTDAQGQFPVEFPTDGYGEDQVLALVARLPADNVAVRTRVRIAVQGFGITLSTPRDVYLDGETFNLSATTLDALGEPTGQDLRVAVIKPVNRAGSVVEREVSVQTFTTDKATGKGQVSLRIEETERVTYTLRVTGTDQFGHPIVSDATVTISGANDAEKMRIIADKTTYRVGETASVRLVNRAKAGTALLTWEADRILRYQIQTIQPGENRVEWAVEGPQFPNFTLNASRMADQRFDEAKLDVKVERDLRISLKPKAATVAPGAEVEVEVTAVDQMGRPVQAELALALVDRTLLRQFNDKLPPIGPFFYDQTRLGSFRTEATNTFRDEPPTQPVSDAVVEEASRQVMLGAQAISLDKVRQDTNNVAMFGMMGRASSDKPALNIPASPAPVSGPQQGQGAGRRGAIGDQAFPYAAVGGGGFGGEAQVRSENRSFADMSGTRARRSKDLSSSGEGDVDFDVLDVDRPPASPDQDRADWAAKMSEKGYVSRASNPAPPRISFVETAYWNPSVVTDANGKATVKFPAPEALSEYRLMAKGVTGAETLVGQSTVNLAVRKDFYVDLRTPSRLTEGDKPRFIARVHHVGIKAGSVVEVRLAGYAGDQDQVDLKSVEIQGDGVDEVLFDPITIPDAEALRLTVSARVGDQVDELTAEVPIHPWGVQAIASASGTSSNDATAFVALPAGRSYDDLGMQIQLAPTLDRLVVELALGQGYVIYERPAPTLRSNRLIWPPIAIDTTADRAADLLAAVSALTYLGDVRSTDAAEATRLRDRARSLIAELVAVQNQDGGWPWVAPRVGQPRVGSDRRAASAAAWAIRAADRAGMSVDANVVNRAGDYLLDEFNRASNDPTGRAAVLHALAVLGRASFEAANTLNRGRQNLDNSALAYLALTLEQLDRRSLANEVLDVLATRAQADPVGPGEPPRIYWKGVSAKDRAYQGETEATALASLAFARSRPASPELAQSVAWLLAHRSGLGWTPHQAKGAAVAAIAAAQGKAGASADRYRLVVTVNDAEVARLDVAGTEASQLVRVPRKVLKVGAKNKVRFQVEGRGTFGYAATLTGFARDFGPEQTREGKPFAITSRDYLPSAPELDGKTLSTGFSKVVNPTEFTNKAAEVARGGRVQVEIRFDQEYRPGLANWQREFLVVEETLPAGTTLVDGSIQTNAGSYTLGDGVIHFAFAPENGVPQIHYEVAGYLPGTYRALPTAVRNAYDPGMVHLGPTGSLKVLTPGAPATDPYRASPDELFARGQALAEAGRLAEAAVPLEELFSGYTPTDDVARDAARILLSAHIASYDPRKIVRDFEILKEKGPDVIIPFDEVLVVGRAYRDIDEPERAYLVFRALAEASYLEDAQVGEVLRQNGRPLEAVAYLLDLWRESPGSASIEADLFGLSQVLTDLAGKVDDDASLREKLIKANLARPDLLLQSIRLIQTTLALNPKTPLADEASLALLGNQLELENYEAVTRLAPRYAQLYPKSSFLDSFQYAAALGRFQLGQFDQAIEVANQIAGATYPDANGVEQPSPNKWQALYILGQIYDARRQPARAIEFYKQVADRFADAADAVNALSHKELKLPEVTILRPASVGIGAAVNLSPRPGQPAGDLILSYRNLTEVDLKVYPVDLMRLYLTRRNLDGIAGIDLAGITPLHESTVQLADGLTFRDATKKLDLPLTKEGAYLVMVRGGDLYASGIVLVSPLELEVTEEAQAGRVRVVVRDAASENFVSKVQVKVIGSNNQSFTDNRTDLRGVAVAEGINGQVTAVVRKGTDQYAFYRGTQAIGATPPARPTPALNGPQSAAGKPLGVDPSPGESLMKNLDVMNSLNQSKGIDRLQSRFNPGRKGIRAEEAK